MNSPRTPQVQLAAVACLLVLATPQWLAAQTYSITELPPLPGDTYCGAFALNENGQAAGYSGNRAVIWTNTAPMDIQTLAGVTSSVAFGLNDSGQATGDVSTGGTSSGAFIWRGLAMERIIPPPGQFINEAYAINNSGVVVGPGGSTGGYRWTSGSFQTLGYFAGDYTARPLAINAWGQIAGCSIGPGGRRPAIWLFTTPQPISVPPGGTGHGQAWGINDLGVVVGEFDTATGTKPFLWSSGLGAQALPLPAGTTTGFAWALNDGGVILGYAGNQSVLWRKNSSGAYEVAFIASLLRNGSGWDRLDLAAINEAGQIAGDGRLNGQGRGFILTPGPSLNLLLRTDADRSGTTEFDGPADATAPGQPFYFWTNDDHDATGGDVENGPVDSADDRILNPVLVTASDGNAAVVRDLEDFARLAFKLTPDLKTALEAGAKLRLEAAGTGTIHLFSTPSAGAETRYLTDEPFAVSLITDVATDVALSSTIDSDGITLWENIETLIKPSDWERGWIRFLWEGVTPGACVLTLKLIQPDGSEIASAPVHVSLRPVRDFFEHVRATPVDGLAPPWETNGVTPNMGREVVHSQLVTPFDEQDVDLVWVHGWRLRKWERQNWAEMMFKRLWHGGYKGRLHAFTWPTYSGDEEPKTDGFLSFDRSEHRAWKSGAALDGYLRVLRNAHSSGRLALIAHSMGNIVTGEALRRGAPADLQIMMQAAVSAGCYDIRAVLEESDLIDHERKDPTPDYYVAFGYRGAFANIAVPTINYYNPEDFALQSGKKIGVQVNWFNHQGDKPYDPNGKGEYKYRNNIAGLFSGKKLVREVTDVDESLAFLARSRSRSRAVGAQALTGRTSSGLSLGIFLQPIDLGTDYGFTGKSEEHSAQFNRPIQRKLTDFYTKIVDTVTSVSTP